MTGKITYSPIRSLKLILSENFSRNQRVWPAESEAYFRQGWITPEMLGDRTWSTLKGDIITATDTLGYFPIPLARRTRSGNLLTGIDWNFYSSSERSGC